jgi:predicted dehydrogenase
MINVNERTAVVGLIGCGSISAAYFNAVARSDALRMKSCSSRTRASAEAKGEQFGVTPVSTEEMLADPEVEFIINLTPPGAHEAVSRQILQAGKHLYSEKPFSTSVEEARSLLDLAGSKGLKVACAPDTFLGSAHQTARRILDDGDIGQPVAGAVTMAGPGPEGFHPNPAFLYAKGAGPLLDIGPYYLTQLVNLLGPVAEVTAVGVRPRKTRTVLSKPLYGTPIEVEVPTTVNGAILFENGANVAITMSWDVWRHGRPPIEIYGSDGSLRNPDPNWFGGEVLTTEKAADWRPADISAQPFGEPNMMSYQGFPVANYRGLGLVDLVGAVRNGRDPRASGALALHVMEVLLCLEQAAERRAPVLVGSRCARPEPVPAGPGETVLLSC